MSKAPRKGRQPVKDLPWVEKYRPRTGKDVIGVDTKKKALESFLKEFPKKRAAVLLGPPGVGKTTLAYTIAADLNRDIIEMNASDARSSDEIKRRVLESTRSKSITDFFGAKEGKIILIDEVDGISGNEDRGGIQTLAEIIQKTEYPILMTCNEWLSKLKKVYDLSEMIKFTAVRRESISKVLERIVEAERCGHLVSGEMIARLSEEARGDFRSAINDLQSLVQGLNRPDRSEETDAGHLEGITATRDEFLSIHEGITKALNETSVSRIKTVLGKIDMPNVTSNYHWDTILSYLLENARAISSKAEHLVDGIDLLAEADAMLGHVKKTQDWSLLSYFIDYLACAVATIKEKAGNKQFAGKVEQPPFSFFKDGSPVDLVHPISKALDIPAADVKEEILPVLRERITDEQDTTFRDSLFEWLEADAATRRKIVTWARK